MTEQPWDTLVVGGGPAGLAGAFWLGRYRRRVLVLDHGVPRNRSAWAVHGFPGVPDTRPSDLRERIREQAEDSGAVIEERQVVRIRGAKDHFTAEDSQGDAIYARRILLAYGRDDRVPEVPGLQPLYGQSVFHCPDCDGPHVVDQRVGVLGHDRPAAALALFLLTWADRTILLTNGLDPKLDEDARDALERHDVSIDTRKVHELVGSDGRLHHARIGDDELPLDALFFHWGSHPASALGPGTGCACDAGGNLEVDSSLETTVPGVYAAGDIIGRPYLIISAAAAGVRAALSIHRSLLPPEFDL